MNHSHECRDCLGEIPCDGPGDDCWDGGNAGCPDCDRYVPPVEF